MSIDTRRRRNRAIIGAVDLMEAAKAASTGLGMSHGFPLADPRFIQRALKVWTIVAYARPFLHSHGGELNQATNRVAVEDLDLPAEALELHGRLIDLRNEAVAHSDYERIYPSFEESIERGRGEYQAVMQASWDEIDAIQWVDLQRHVASVQQRMSERAARLNDDLK